MLITLLGQAGFGSSGGSGGLPSWFWMQHLPTALFVFAFGACVGSFINVVVYRLPAGMSVIHPPSRCPVCGARLRWFENLPILGWLFVRGRCRYCNVSISPQYMLIELIMGLLFLGLYVTFYTVPPSTVWWGQIGSRWWHDSGLIMIRGGLGGTWPAFIAWSFLLAGLVAMTLIDARTFTIPLEIPVVITLVAFVAYPLQTLISTPLTQTYNFAIPGADWTCFSICTGGMLGIGLSIILMRLGIIHHSFRDYHEYVKDDEVLADYPHARREMLVELVYLVPCVVGILAGWLISQWLPATGPPRILGAIGGAFAGYLAGGGLMWACRIIFTYVFGREAMGMGDVHLLAAIGATLGWFEPLRVFLIAPFLALGWHALTIVMTTVSKKQRRELPYGPYLAAAVLIVIFLRPGVTGLERLILGSQWQPPAPTLVP